MTGTPTATQEIVGRNGQSAPALPQREGTDINVGEIERWASLLGGGALLIYGLTRRSWGGLSLAAAGGGLLYRGAMGHCPVYQALGVDTAGEAKQGIHVEKAVTINRPMEELYRFWRDFENLPRFMHHLKSVTVSDERHSHWVATAPAGASVEWDAEITADRENEQIAWRSLEGSEVPNSGQVRFVPAPGGRGTEVRVSLDYAPPAGLLGATFARLFGEEPSQQVEKDLLRFKNLMEAGEIPTTDGQPHG